MKRIMAVQEKDDFRRGGKETLRKARQSNIMVTEKADERGIDVYVVTLPQKFV